MQHELLGQYFTLESSLQSAAACQRGMAPCTARFSGERLPAGGCIAPVLSNPIVLVTLYGGPRVFISATRETSLKTCCRKHRTTASNGSRRESYDGCRPSWKGAITHPCVHKAEEIAHVESSPPGQLTRRPCTHQLERFLLAPGISSSCVFFSSGEDRRVFWWRVVQPVCQRHLRRPRKGVGRLR